MNLSKSSHTATTMLLNSILTTALFYVGYIFVIQLIYSPTNSFLFIGSGIALCIISEIVFSTFLYRMENAWHNKKQSNNTQHLLTHLSASK